MKVAVIIPFRDRGIDPLRQANLDAVERQWWEWQTDRPDRLVLTVSDGREGDAQFNRSAAYNRGVAYASEADVFVFAESDMLIDSEQIDKAVERATECPGLVIPFTEYVALTPKGSEQARRDFNPWIRPVAYRMINRAIGAINVVSRESLDRIGRYDETFDGSWYDDNAMEIAFQMTCGMTYFIDGPAWHLHHLPGYRGNHLTDEDRAATERNKRRLNLYREADTPARIKFLTAGGS